MNPATKRKQVLRQWRAELGIRRVEVALLQWERQQLEALRITRTDSGQPYAADEYISTLLRHDWEA